MTKMDFTKYVHKYETNDGQIRYAVGYWEVARGQYTVPHDATKARLTGCSSSFAQNRPTSPKLIPVAQRPSAARDTSTTRWIAATMI
jgi:hypothetical protein